MDRNNSIQYIRAHDRNHLIIPKTTMSNFIYSTSDKLNGPWLIDEQALLELDNIIDTAFEVLNKSNEEFLDRILDKELHERIEREKLYKQIDGKEIQEIEIEDIKK